MLRLGSRIVFAENSGVKAMRIFHMGLKKTFKKSTVSVNNIIRGSIIHCLPHKKVAEGDKISAIIVQVKRKISRLSGCYINFGFNYGIVLSDPKRRKPLATDTKLTVTKEFR